MGLLQVNFERVSCRQRGPCRNDETQEDAKGSSHVDHNTDQTQSKHGQERIPQIAHDVVQGNDIRLD